MCIILYNVFFHYELEKNMLCWFLDHVRHHSGMTQIIQCILSYYVTVGKIHGCRSFPFLQETLCQYFKMMWHGNHLLYI